jgi:Bor protein
MSTPPSPRTTRCALFAMLFAIAASGCYKATFIANPNLVRGQDHDQWNSFFLWGLVGDETLDVRQFCGGGQVAQVRTGANVLTGLVSFVTLGIYAPRMAYVWCAAGTTVTPSAPRVEGAPAAPASAPTLSIYGDARGRPIRVELRRDGALESVATPILVAAEQSRWEVAFAREVER